jgi:thiamine-phosphate pyrophosphorylase
MRTILITKNDKDLPQKVEAACKGGIDGVQLSDKEMQPRDLLHLAKKLRAITWQYNTALFINSYPDIAMAVQADGVHLPENHYSPLPMMTGASVHSMQAAKKAEQQGVDFMFYSPIFASPGKAAPVGLDALRSLVLQTAIPIYALGGVTADKIPDILSTGAHGVAAISAILDAPDVEAAAKGFAMHFQKPKFSFRGVLGIVSCLETGRAAVHKGVAGIQFRYKDPYTEEVFRDAAALRFVCQNADIPFFINDRVDIAKALDVTGVHLGQTDLPIREARRILGPDKIIGATASNSEEANSAVKCGADYIGLGAVFPTQSKLKTIPPIGLSTVSEVKKQIPVPLIAIGGINKSNAASVFQAGADGVAVLSALFEVLCP